MLSQDSLEQAVRAAGLDADPIFLEETGSTNSEARALAEDGAPEWTVVAAGHQIAGRGRLGRSWADAPGKALLFSVVLRPRLEPVDAPLLSLLAAERMLAACAPPGAKSKWPNDLVVGDRKLAGILAEASVTGGTLRHLVLGIGVNVSMREGDFPKEVRASATSLAIEGGETDSASLLTKFLAGFRENYGRPAPEVVDAYVASCSTIGHRVRATTTSGREVEGAAVGVDRHGGLLVESGGRTHVVAFGEVADLD